MPVYANSSKQSLPKLKVDEGRMKQSQSEPNLVAAEAGKKVKKFYKKYEDRPEFKWLPRGAETKMQFQPVAKVQPQAQPESHVPASQPVEVKVQLSEPISESHKMPLESSLPELRVDAKGFSLNEPKQELTFSRVFPPYYSHSTTSSSSSSPPLDSFEDDGYPNVLEDEFNPLDVSLTNVETEEQAESVRIRSVSDIISTLNFSSFVVFVGTRNATPEMQCSEEADNPDRLKLCPGPCPGNACPFTHLVSADQYPDAAVDADDSYLSVLFDPEGKKQTVFGLPAAAPAQASISHRSSSAPHLPSLEAGVGSYYEPEDSPISFSSTASAPLAIHGRNATKAIKKTSKLSPPGLSYTLPRPTNKVSVSDLGNWQDAPSIGGFNRYSITQKSAPSIPSTFGLSYPTSPSPSPSPSIPSPSYIRRVSSLGDIQKLPTTPQYNVFAPSYKPLSFSAVLKMSESRGRSVSEGPTLTTEF